MWDLTGMPYCIFFRKQKPLHKHILPLMMIPNQALLLLAYRFINKLIDQISNIYNLFQQQRHKPPNSLITCWLSQATRVSQYI